MGPRRSTAFIGTLILASGLLMPAMVSAQEAFKLVPEGQVDDTTCMDDAMLVFDASGSMASAGYNEMENPRIFEALKAVRRVLPRVTQYRRIGLVVYGPGPKDACQNFDLRLAPAYNSSSRIISELERTEPDGDTPLTQAVRDAAEMLDYKNKPAVVVLVTDGDETCGGAPCRLPASLLADARALSVHVIGFKVRDRFFQWQSQSNGDVRGETNARCLADMTGGKYVSTETTDELVAALQTTLGCPLLTQAPGG